MENIPAPTCMLPLCGNKYWVICVSVFLEVRYYSSQQCNIDCLELKSEVGQSRRKGMNPSEKNSLFLMLAPVEFDYTCSSLTFWEISRQIIPCLARDPDTGNSIFLKDLPLELLVQNSASSLLMFLTWSTSCYPLTQNPPKKLDWDDISWVINAYFFW